ncbi:MAG: FKBP-type peptidyl-prolyl cis-trans isomerase [Magnetococcus sp. DMHC-6]
MKSSHRGSCLSLLVVPVLFWTMPAHSASSKLDNFEKKAGYVLGLQMGARFKGIPLKLDSEAMLQGIRDGLEGTKPAIEQEEAMQIEKQMEEKMRQEMASRTQALADKNLKEGVDFLTKNKSEKGVVTTASGLQYLVLTQGNGPKPTPTDKVQVHYKGTLLDGTEFDSSYKRNKPVTFPLGNVIPGWTEGVQLMNVGSKYRLFIPSELAYGKQGPRGIGPNATLVFEIELLAIEK